MAGPFVWIEMMEMPIPLRFFKRSGNTGRAAPGHHPDPVGDGLALLARCQGKWQGFLETASGHQQITVDLQRSPDGYFFIAHYQLGGAGGLRGFEVLAIDPDTGELTETSFSVGRSGESRFNWTHISSTRPGHGRVVAETLGWDEARPAEFKWTLDYRPGELTLTREACLLHYAEECDVQVILRLTRVAGRRRG